MQPFTPPALKVKAFNCPHCNAFANQHWHAIQTSAGHAVDGFTVANCAHCYKSSIWFQASMVYPNKVTAPLPNPDLPEDIKIDFEEARQILIFPPKELQHSFVW